MKKSILNYHILLLIVFFIASCEMFSNDPGEIPEEEVDTDVAISVAEEPQAVVVGQRLELTLEIENTGQEDINENFSIIIEDQATDSVIATIEQTETLPAGSSVTVEHLWTVNGQTGTYDILITHDLNDENSGNDSATVSLQVMEQQPQDLAITSLSGPATVEPGTTAPIELILTNTGSEAFVNEVTISLINETIDEPIETRIINIDLASGNSVDLEFDWTTGSLSPGEYTISAQHSFEDNTPNNNARNITVNIEGDNTSPEGTDIAITALSHPASAEQGEELNFEVIVENTGDEDTDQPIVVTLQNATNNATISTEEISNGLAAGDNTTLTFNWNTENVQAGEYEIVARHNVDDNNESNNFESSLVTINETQANSVDISITEFRGPSETVVGEDIDLFVTIGNLGNSRSDGDFEFIVTDETDDSVIETRVIDEEIESGGDRSFRVGWNTIDASPGEHTISVTHTYDDGQTENNSRTITLFLTELSVESIDPNRIDSDQEGRITVQGSGFREGIDISFSRNNGPPFTPPEVSDIQVDNVNTLSFHVEARRDWFNFNRNVEWDMVLTYPSGTEFIYEDALTVENGGDDDDDDDDDDD